MIVDKHLEASSCYLTSLYTQYPSESNYTNQIEIKHDLHLLIPREVSYK